MNYLNKYQMLCVCVGNNTIKNNKTYQCLNNLFLGMEVYKYLDYKPINNKNNIYINFGQVCLV